MFSGKTVARPAGNPIISDPSWRNAPLYFLAQNWCICELSLNYGIWNTRSCFPVIEIAKTGADASRFRPKRRRKETREITEGSLKARDTPLKNAVFSSEQERFLFNKRWPEGTYLKHGLLKESSTRVVPERLSDKRKWSLRTWETVMLQNDSFPASNCTRNWFPIRRS